MFKIPASERLTHWRDFRKELDHLPLETAIQCTVDMWTKCPFNPYYLDSDQPEIWPDPWTLIEENYYCDLAKALGMLYTIKFTQHDPSVELRLYLDPETNYTYHVVWVQQGKYILNLVDNLVITNNTQSLDHLTLKKTFDQQLNLNNY
jgi:hypothetical protein